MSARDPLRTACCLLCADGSSCVAGVVTPIAAGGDATVTVTVVYDYSTDLTTWCVSTCLRLSTCACVIVFALALWNLF